MVTQVLKGLRLSVGDGEITQGLVLAGRYHLPSSKERDALSKAQGLELPKRSWNPVQEGLEPRRHCLRWRGSGGNSLVSPPQPHLCPWSTREFWSVMEVAMAGSSSGGGHRGPRLGLLKSRVWEGPPWRTQTQTPEEGPLLSRFRCLGAQSKARGRAVAWLLLESQAGVGFDKTGSSSTGEKCQLDSTATSRRNCPQGGETLWGCSQD